MNVPEVEKPRITEIKVRMDCNGCVQKIKKALQGVTGIYDLYVDFPQQKITIIGWADPEKLVRAIKKTRKTAIICSHVEQEPDHQNTDQPPEGNNNPPGDGGPPPSNDKAKPPETETAQPQPPPQAEAQNEAPPPPQENPPPPPPETGSDTKKQPNSQAKPRDAEEIHVIYHHPPDYGYRYAYGRNLQQGPGDGHFDAYGQVHNLRQGPGVHFNARGSHNSQQGGHDVYFDAHGSHNSQRVHGGHFDSHGHDLRQDHSSHFNDYPGSSGYRGEPYHQLPPPPAQTGYVTTHSYNTYKPSPYVTEYVSYPRSPPPPPPPRYSYYSRPDHHYHQDYYYYSGNNGSGNGNITSMFSDENPNACTIA